MSEKRSDPNTFLQKALEEEQQNKRGKLKIYLGAAPGVGKTYTMLHEALGEQNKGLDIIVGVVESHGRMEIEELINKFTLLPKISLEYHGKKLQEFDLDAALNRNPGLILMDEMAHTNVSGLRHKKRWQDIKELLDRGINVCTTLNIQHIESLNDEVSRLIHAPIQETIPDAMIEMANTIELVDLAPEDLLKRLAEGKVYVPKQARLAAESYFRKGNLLALRELVLRTLAKRVNIQALLYRKDQGIKTIWPLSKILVCVGPGPESIKLIRSAKRLATNLQAEWIAVYVDSTRSQAYKIQRNQAIKNLFFAEQLGAETQILIGYDFVNEIIKFSRARNVTLIMIWKHIRNRFRKLFFKSLADEIVRYSNEIDVYTMTGQTREKYKLFSFPKPSTPLFYYFLTSCIVTVTTLLNLYLFPYLRDSNLIMIYLMAMVLIALLGRTGPAILGIVLSVISYEYFFTKPFYTLLITSADNIFTLITMLIIAFIMCQLALVSRRKSELSRLVEYQTSALYTLSKKLSSTRGIVRLLKTGTNYISEVFHCHVLALLPKNGELVIHPRSKVQHKLDAKEQSIAQWVFELGQKAGLGTDTLSFSDALYIPLLGKQETIGVLRIQPFQNLDWESPEKIQFIETFANQIALALEVENLQEQKNKMNENK